MTNEVALKDSEGLVVITAEHVDLIRRTIAKDATAEELQLFFYDCRRRGVHPLDRMIHFTKRKGRYAPITSIDFMRTRAAETGECAGIDDPMFDVTNGAAMMTATVVVYRLTQGARYPYTATARWSEYFPGNDKGQGEMWLKMPHTMLGKCAEALALRKAFPQQLAGLYAREEMDQAGGGVAVRSIDPATGEVVESESQIVEPRSDGSALVAAVDTKQGKRGPWWLVTFDDGRTGSAFDATLADQARKAQQSRILVFPTLEQKGQYTNLIGLAPLDDAPTKDTPPSVVLINERQVRMFNAVATGHGWSDAERHELLSVHGFASSKDITTDALDDILTELKKRQPEGER